MMTRADYERAAMRVKALVEDPDLAAAFAKIADGYYADFLASETPEAREAAWAKARAVRDVQADLRAVIDAGTYAGRKPIGVL